MYKVTRIFINVTYPSSKFSIYLSCQKQFKVLNHDFLKLIESLIVEFLPLKRKNKCSILNSDVCCCCHSKGT